MQCLTGKSHWSYFGFDLSFFTSLLVKQSITLHIKNLWMEKVPLRLNGPHFSLISFLRRTSGAHHFIALMWFIEVYKGTLYVQGWTKVVWQLEVEVSGESSPLTFTGPLNSRFSVFMNNMHVCLLGWLVHQVWAVVSSSSLPLVYMYYASPTPTSIHLTIESTNHMRVAMSLGKEGPPRTEQFYNAKCGYGWNDYLCLYLVVEVFLELWRS